MTYVLATLNLNGTATPVVKVGERYFPLAAVSQLQLDRPERGLLALFADAITSGAVNAQALDVEPSAENFLTPLRYPAKVVCFGANYYEHMHEDAGMRDYNKADVVPVMFIKPAATALVGSGRSVRYPSQSEKFDWEIELAAIIGKRGRKVKAANARDHIAAFTIGVDLSARDWQLHPKHPFKFDCFGGKAFDDSCPLGPWLVPARFVDDGNVDLKLFLNGDLKQDANTRNMIWTLDEQIEEMSKHMTLEPGDVIMTGTPAGVGMKTGTYMKVGDRITAEIETIGTLEFEIMPDQDDALDTAD
jgi:2-keto-4-pentenoate hydratase/2-oxohepta-3-ene-1,7-dioic acid hydratase in catechol pathway